MHGPTFIFWASLTPVLSCYSGAEVNFWVPLTRVFGTNTLFVESAPGRGDFRPVELGYGACFRRWSRFHRTLYIYYR
jgi:hypothetical protein